MHGIASCMALTLVPKGRHVVAAGASPWFEIIVCNSPKGTTGIANSRVIPSLQDFVNQHYFFSGSRPRLHPVRTSWLKTS